MYLCVAPLVPKEAREGSGYHGMGVTVWALGTESRSSAKAESVSNHRIISPAPGF